VQAAYELHLKETQNLRSKWGVPHPIETMADVLSLNEIYRAEHVMRKYRIVAFVYGGFFIVHTVVVGLMNVLIILLFIVKMIL